MVEESSMVIVPIASATVMAFGGCGKEGENAAEHIYTGRNHRGGMQQRTDRGRTFHRVGQPGEQRKLRALAHNAAERSAWPT